MISEYGYPALGSAMSLPWNEMTMGTFNSQLQAQLIKTATQVLLEQMNPKSQPQSETKILKAAFLWN